MPICTQKLIFGELILRTCHHGVPGNKNAYQLILADMCQNATFCTDPFLVTKESCGIFTLDSAGGMTRTRDPRLSRPLLSMYSTPANHNRQRNPYRSFLISYIRAAKSQVWYDAEILIPLVWIRRARMH